jgi:phage terminase small subunit
VPNLTPKQARFVDEYLVDLNATQAAIRAGYSARTAQWIGPQLLGKSHVNERIASAQRERSAQTGITAARVVQEIARVAFADPRMIAQWDNDTVSMRASSELSDDEAAAVAEVKSTKEGVSVKLHNKVAALEQLAKHVGLYAERPSEGDGARTVVVYLPDNGR